MKTYLLAGLAVLAFAGAVQAQTKIYITGSSAFRGTANDQIVAALGGTTGPTPAVIVAQSNGTLASANAVIIRNFGNTTRVYASWTGSAAGVQSVAGNGATNTKTWFLSDANSGTVGDPNAASPNANRTQETPDIAFSDTYQGATPFNGTFGGVTYQSLTDTIVGVVPFQWAASNGFPTGVSITPQIIKQFLGNGSLPLSFFTGSLADNNANVYATGRNPDSGTRITVLAESKYGISTPVTQYKPATSGSGASASIDSLALYPIETINGISTGADGNSGENSGGTVRAYLNATFTLGAAQTYTDNIDGTAVTRGYFLTYLGAADANSTLGATNLPAVPVAYNGIVYRTGSGVYNTGAVISGAYSLWGYEHIMLRSGSSAAAFATTLANNIKGVATSGLAGNVKYSDMKVSRASDGADIGSTIY